MPFCPKCGYEYLPTATECPDCGERLVAQLPASPGLEQKPPVDEPLVVVYEPPDEVLEIMVREVLKEAGIPAVRHLGFDLAFDGLLRVPSGYHSQLLVFESQAAEARRIIADYLREVGTGEAAREAECEEAQIEAQIEEMREDEEPDATS